MSTDAVIFRTRARAFAGTLLALTACLGVSAGRAAAVEPGFVTDMTWYTSHAEQDRTAAGLKDSGSRMVRLSISWRDAEPTRGSYNDWWLEEYDGAIARAGAAGQRVLVMLNETPAWASASGAEYAPPRDPADFARFARFIAERYAGKGVEGYEIWNEPNFDRFWTTGPDAAEYSRLLKASYPAVKAGDPQAKVVFAGTSTNDWRFIEAAYAAGAKGNFDVMATHPYSCTRGPEHVEREPGGRMRKDSFLAYREIRASMIERGDAKPIWFTEWGWSTASGGCGVSAAEQAVNITRALELASSDPYVEVALYYNYRNNYWQNDADDVEAQFGLTRTDFSRKPAYAAFKAFATAPRPEVPSRPGTDDTSMAAPDGQPAASDPGSTQPTTSEVTAPTSARPVTLRIRPGAQGRRYVTAAGTLTGAATGTVKLTAFYSRANAERYTRVASRWVVVRRGTFKANVSRFRRGRWRVLASLRGTPSAVQARQFRLEDGAGGDPLPPGLSDDGRRALGDEAGPVEDGTVEEQAVGEADFTGDGMESPGELDSGGYLLEGSRDADVADLQHALDEAGHPLEADGAFGDETDAAVRAFQRSEGLVVDGVVGRQTMAALERHGAR